MRISAGWVLAAAVVLCAVSVSAALTADEQGQQNARIFKAATEDDPIEIQAAFKDGAQLDFVFQQRGGQGPLMAACLGGKDKAVAALLKLGADPKIGSWLI
ncbi:hypothetical protein T484DRAFT_1767588 [Baffinella frigidus]|nr:hypothetical protein T484DRAFT_1767588 [Cryptophyta sp. CCMP2293]